MRKMVGVGAVEQWVKLPHGMLEFHISVPGLSPSHSVLPVRLPSNTPERWSMMALTLGSCVCVEDLGEAPASWLCYNSVLAAIGNGELQRADGLYLLFCPFAFQIKSNLCNGCH